MLYEVITLRIGVPKTTELAFFGGTAFSEAVEQTLRTIACLPNVNLMEIDFQPFQQAAQLLYNGPWLAERYAAVGVITSYSIHYTKLYEERHHTHGHDRREGQVYFASNNHHGKWYRHNGEKGNGGHECKVNP